MWTLIGVVAAGTMGLATWTQASVLGHINFAQSYDLPMIVSPTGAIASSAVSVSFAFSLPGGGPTDATTLVFDEFLISNDDDGRLITLASEADDAELPKFFQHATNGLDEELGVNVIGNLGGGSGIVDLESNRMQKLPIFVGPDLAGATLTGLELFISAIVIDPNAATPMQNWSIVGQMRFLGTAPTAVSLPGGVAGLASALALLASTRKRRAIGNRQIRSELLRLNYS